MNRFSGVKRKLDMILEVYDPMKKPLTVIKILKAKPPTRPVVVIVQGGKFND